MKGMFHFSWKKNLNSIAFCRFWITLLRVISIQLNEIKLIELIKGKTQ